MKLKHSLFLASTDKVVISSKMVDQINDPSVYGGLAFNYGNTTFIEAQRGTSFVTLSFQMKEQKR